MGEAAADRAHVAHHRIADMAGDLGHERGLALEHGRGLDGVVRGEGSDDEGPAFLLHAGQRRDLADVDHVLGLRETELHGGQEAVAARQDLGVVLVLGEKVEGLLDRAGLVILELGWIHECLPYFCDLAAWMLCQTRAAVRGMASRWAPPPPESASTTAFMRAGVGARGAVSPAPVSRSGLSRLGAPVR